MNQYLIIWQYNNGYTCSCCRTTWTDTEIREFDSDEDATEFADSFKNAAYDETQLQAIYKLASEGVVIYEN